MKNKLKKKRVGGVAQVIEQAQSSDFNPQYLQAPQNKTERKTT
jgi:hypothetical protein